MKARIWSARLDSARILEYEDFVRRESLPMFRAQRGFLAAFFLRSIDQCRVVTLWSDADAVERLAESAAYAATVGRLRASGLLVAAQGLEVHDLDGLHLDSRFLLHLDALNVGDLSA